MLRFDLADDDRLVAQVAAIRALREPRLSGQESLRLAAKLLALEAVDARSDGASLRETAASILGPGDWPGDGEHRKSYVRRLLKIGEQMIRAGPRAILDQF
ncbi:DNA -binding domain-containing protein [Sphingomonas profundi]|uniref:DNA -binding domain-containing protein n=1 Tax=Alterirhizorhabdus profundi TaxID=2681549 RepID=UPI003BB128E7